MKKLLILLFLLTTAFCFGTHNMAGDISYRYIGSPTEPYKYEVTVRTFTKWIGSSGTDRCELTVHFGDGDSAVAPRVNGLSGVDCPTAANGVLIFSAVKYNVYVTSHNYDGPGNYIIYMDDTNRSAGICNVASSENVSFYLEAKLNISPFWGQNNAPAFNSIPIIYTNVGVITTYTPTNVESDGDSLYYDIITPMASGTYLSGYMVPPSTNSFTIDHSTGTVTWDTPPYLCFYVFDIRILEYRNIGTSYYQVSETMQEIWAEVGPFMSVDEDNNHISVDVFPNPSNDYVNFQISGKIKSDDLSINIYNSLGQNVKTIAITDENFQLQNGELSPGIYSYSLMADGKPLNNGKFVILQGFVK